MLFLSNHNFLNLFFCFFFLGRQTDVFEQLFLYDSDNFQQILFIERPIGILHLDLYFVYINVSIVAEFLFLCVNGRDTEILTFKYCSLTSLCVALFVYLDLESRVLLFFYLYLVSHGCLEFWHLIKTQWFSFICLQFSTLFRFVPFRLR